MDNGDGGSNNYPSTDMLTMPIAKYPTVEILPDSDPGTTVNYYRVDGIKRTRTP
jgi:hypothetical protein